jgi:hypothetical protein
MPRVLRSPKPNSPRLEMFRFQMQTARDASGGDWSVDRSALSPTMVWTKQAQPLLAIGCPPVDCRLRNRRPHQTPRARP